MEKIPVENLHTLTITELYRRNPLRVSSPPADLVLWRDDGFWDWSHIAPLPSGLILETAFFYANDGRPAGVHLCYFLGEKEIRYFLELRAVRQTSRGYHYYFRCPCCHHKRPVSILYLPPGQTHFACRYCHHLAYSATAISPVGQELASRPKLSSASPAPMGSEALAKEALRLIPLLQANKSPPFPDQLTSVWQESPVFRQKFADHTRLRPKTPKMSNSISMPALQKAYRPSIAATTAHRAKKIKFPKSSVHFASPTVIGPGGSALPDRSEEAYRRDKKREIDSSALPWNNQALCSHHKHNLTF